MGGVQFPGPAVRAIEVYDARNPQWFAAWAEDAPAEGVYQALHEGINLFAAKALIAGESRARLLPYLDVPGFLTGDLFYIRKLVMALEAAHR